MITGYRDLVKIKKCARCGYDENKGSLHVHHLDKNRYNNSRKNLIVLCANCHYGLHQGKWKLEDIGIKTRPVQRNILKKRSVKIEIKDIHHEISSLKASIESISVNPAPYPVYEYSIVKNNKYIARNSELRLYVKDTRVFTPSEYDKIILSVNNTSISAIFDILTSTGINYEELLQIYQFKELYKMSNNTITILRHGEPCELRVSLFFKYWLKFLLEIPKIPSEDSLNRILQAFASKNDISPVGVSLLSLRKTIESWMLKCGIPEIEIYGRQGHDPVTSLRHYQSLSFTDYEMRDIEKRLTEWGILRK